MVTSRILLVLFRVGCFEGGEHFVAVPCLFTGSGPMTFHPHFSVISRRKVQYKV